MWGILFAVLALFCWGIGDFLIQRSARKFGNWVALFYITAFGSFFLLPFVWGILGDLVRHPSELIILLVTSGVMLFAALFEFQALKVGKLSVIEPVYALEVPITVLLASFLLQEGLGFWPTILIVTLLVGIFLVSVKGLKIFKKLHLEKGVWLAVIATAAMGVVNFLFGVGARATDPLVMNWFLSVFIAVVALFYLFFTKRLGDISKGWRQSKKLILAVSIFDNLAWIAYGAGVLFAPIALVIGISESYIAFAAILGLIINKEKLQRHQWFGLAVAVVAVVILAIITE